MLKIKEFKYYSCPDCSGDGKDTCHNPDHGWINAGIDIELSRLGCPVCGYDEDHKTNSGEDCETCEGSGIVIYDVGIKYLKAEKIDFMELEPINKNTTNIKR